VKIIAKLLAHAGQALVRGARAIVPVTAWVTASGQIIPIAEMGDRHLVHSANLLLRSAREHAAWVLVAMASRDDVDLFDVTESISIGATMATVGDDYPRLAPLLAEIRRRGLFVETDDTQIVVPGVMPSPEVACGMHPQDSSNGTGGEKGQGQS
jgi:hypothetical protein